MSIVENSIKHGILPLESVEGLVHINIYEREKVLYIEVRDNGIGIVKAKQRSDELLHESFGLDNIRKRIEQLGVILDKEIAFVMNEEKTRLNRGIGQLLLSVCNCSN